jgi:hypothetical protein
MPEYGLVLVAYCTGFISVCTILLFIATIFTVQNYRMLRRMSEVAPGAHDEDAVGQPAARRAGAAQRRPVERYDSGDTVDTGAGEWTGPVTPYTPAARKPR